MFEGSGIREKIFSKDGIKPLLLPLLTTENPPAFPALSLAYFALIWYFSLKLCKERKAYQNTKADKCELTIEAGV